MKTITERYICYVTLLFLGSIGSVWGQSGESNLREKLLNTVSPSFTQLLSDRYNLYINAKKTKDFSRLYSLISEGVLNGRTEEQFIQESALYYSESVTFISFYPSSIRELHSNLQKPSMWLIDGCLSESIDGKKRKIHATLEARLENGEIYFSELDTRARSFGTPEKCE